MSNLAMNIIPEKAAVPNSSVTKKISAQDELSQVTIKKGDMVLGESADGILSTRIQNFSFNQLLQKYMSAKNSNSQAGDSYSMKQPVDNTELTNDKQKPDVKDKKKKNEYFMSDVWVPSRTAADSPKSTANTVKSEKMRTAKAIQTKPVENTKPIVNKEVKEKTETPNNTKQVSDELTKTVKQPAEDGNNVSENQAVKPVKQANIQDIVETDTNPKEISQAKQIHKFTFKSDEISETKYKAVPAEQQSKLQSSTDSEKQEQSVVTGTKAENKTVVSQVQQQTDTNETFDYSKQSDPVYPRIQAQRDLQPVSSSIVTSNGIERQTARPTYTKPSEQLIEQIQNKITGNTQEIRVTLNPADLGSVKITFRQEDGQVEGLLEVQDSEVRKDIEKALPQIATVLAQNGLQVRRLDVTAMPSPQQNNQQSQQSLERDFNPADHQYLNDQGTHGLSRGSTTAIPGEIIEQAEIQQSEAHRVYDLTGLNMFA